ncbi:uncharacterized protein LOC132057592 [Lycium ferocissimum]|uniref:uncharacterized protein LOC132057592 n=1 Tax=Lycium ferocissimum TaxID=112874 RepID=UPI002816288A|nr:uncharacterized protein LOC132057592 [Lycium ferocissimum]
MNSGTTYGQYGPTYFPPLAYQAIVNSTLLQPNIPTNTQTNNQTNTITPANTNNSYRGPKAKLSFSDFDCNNPRGWIRRCEKFFELYQISPNEKMSYVAVHINKKMDAWFDVYVMEHGGVVTWEGFCLDVCHRYGNIRPMDIVIDFNRLQQWADVESYFNKFEELRFYLMLINPTLNRAYFVYCFVGGLKSDLASMIRASNPQNMIDALEVAKLHEQTLVAIYKNIQPTKVSYSQPKITFPSSPKGTTSQIPKALPPIVTRPQLALPKNPIMETLRDKRGTRELTVVDGEGSGTKEDQEVESTEEPKTLPPNRSCDHAIELITGAGPVNQRPYHYSHEQKDANIVNEILEARTVRPSTSPYGSSLILVKNKDSTWRLCVDYRKLNDITIKNKCPIPVVEDLLNELNGAHFYSKLDLRSGFAQNKVEYLGHVITGDGVNTDFAKIEAMVKWSIPVFIKGLCGFLGLTGCYRRLLQTYAMISKPLTVLLKKGVSSG